jgi:DNA polymerase IV
MPLDLPITYLLSAHIPDEKRLQLEDEIPNLTYDITEAKLVLGKVATKKRAEFELRSRKLWTEEVKETEGEEKYPVADQGNGRRSQEEGPARKKRRTGPFKIPDHVEVVVLDSSTESEAEEDENQKRSVRGRSGSSTQSEDVQSPAQSLRKEITSSPPREKSPHTPRTATASQEGPVFNGNGTIKVVKLSWFEESVAAGRMLPLDGYTVYEGRRVEAPKHRNVMKVCFLAHVKYQSNNQIPATQKPTTRGDHCSRPERLAARFVTSIPQTLQSAAISIFPGLRDTSHATHPSNNL